LDQIASAARYINSGGTSSVPAPVTSAAAPRQPTEVASAPRYHTVVQGDSLSRISLRYFGTANRWQEIYDANREMLSTENVLRPGQQLLIP
jgi:nucleoid-associated protein YgaU